MLSFFSQLHIADCRDTPTNIAFHVAKIQLRRTGEIIPMAKSGYVYIHSKKVLAQNAITIDHFSFEHLHVNV